MTLKRWGIILLVGLFLAPQVVLAAQTWCLKVDKKDPNKVECYKFSMWGGKDCKYDASDNFIYLLAYDSEEECNTDKPKIMADGFCKKVTSDNKDHDCYSKNTNPEQCKPDDKNIYKIATFPSFPECSLYKTDYNSLQSDVLKNFNVVPPEMSISIPGLDFSKVKVNVPDDEGFVYIPFIGMYLNSIYQFALVVASILAVIVIIVGGARYVVSGGNAEQVTSAKKMIGGAIVGLLLAYISYIVLYTINPDLVNFKTLKVQVVEPKDPPALGFSDNDSVGGPIGKATYDELFKKFASCIGVNWQVLKGIAWGESRLTPAALHNKSNPNSAQGLFQTYTKYCAKGLAGTSWAQYCDTLGITNAAVNAYLVTKTHFSHSVPLVKKKCGSASVRDQVFLTYYYNAMPSRMMKSIDRLGCDTSKWLVDSEIPYLFPDKKHLLNFKNRIDVIMSQGISSYSGEQNDATCPLKNGAKPSDFPN